MLVRLRNVYGDVNNSSRNRMFIGIGVRNFIDAIINGSSLTKYNLLTRPVFKI